MAKLSQQVEIKTATLKVIVNGRQNNLREVIRRGNQEEIAGQEVTVMRVLHALANLYTSVNFEKLSDEDVTFLISECSQFVISEYPMLGIEEIKQAFRLAASKKIPADLTAWNGQFTVSMLGAVLSSYLKFRRSIISKVENIKSIEQSREVDPNKDEKNNKVRKQVIETYLNLKSIFKKEGTIREELIQAYWGKILDREGLIPFTDKVKLAVYQEAKVICRKEIIAELLHPDIPPVKKRESKALLKRIDQGEKPKEFFTRVDIKYAKLIVIKGIMS